jgi:hypothetical protein
MRNGWAGSIRPEAETVCLSERDADGSSVASDHVASIGFVSEPTTRMAARRMIGLDSARTICADMMPRHIDPEFGGTSGHKRKHECCVGGTCKGMSIV